MTIEDLLSKNNLLQTRVAELDGALTHRDKYIEQLEEAVRLLRLRQFAPKSEKFISEDTNQDEMVFDEIEANADASIDDDESDDDQLDLIHVGAHSKKRPKRKALPKDLPREIVTIELPEDARRCPHDNTELKVIGHTTSERIDVIPMQIKVIETRRVTYACPCCAGFMKTAPVAPQIVPKGLPTAGTLAFIATSKFVDGISLYHTSKMIERASGIELSRGMMANWMMKVHQAAQPILNLLEDEVIASNYLQMDETTIQVLKEEDRKAQSKSYMWVRYKPGERSVVLFDYDPSRRGEIAERLLADFKGRLQCDGFSGYDRLEKCPGIIRHGCMAHARRKLREAVKVAGTKSNIAKHALKLCQKLYRIEEFIKGKPPNEVLRIRQEKAVMILNELITWVRDHLHKVPPKSPTGKALLYIHNEWLYLERYVDEGTVMIDNNFVENKIRPFVIGRKRWLFSDTVDGAKASAAIYSLVETAKANGLEPYKYLRHLFEKLPQASTLADFEALLPWNSQI
jgi:transposase